MIAPVHHRVGGVEGPAPAFRRPRPDWAVAGGAGSAGGSGVLFRVVLLLAWWPGRDLHGHGGSHRRISEVDRLRAEEAEWRQERDRVVQEAGPEFVGIVASTWRAMGRYLGMANGRAPWMVMSGAGCPVQFLLPD